MRDIKPTGNIRKVPPHKDPEKLPPEAERHLQKHAEKTSKRRFTGSKVSIANVHVPKQVVAEKTEHRPLFASVPTNTQKHAKKKRIYMSLGGKERTIILSLLGALALMGGIAAFIFLPTASIALTIQTAPLLVDQKLTIASNNAAVPNAIPGSIFTQQVDVQGSSPVTSTEVVGAKATGKVQLINKTFDEQKIKEKSRLVTKEGVLFYMVGSATIPEASPSGVSSITVDVEAAEAGEQGNIAAHRLNFAALDSSAQSLVYGQSVDTFTGGSGETVAVIKETDIEQAKAAASSQARLQVEQAAQSQLQKGWLLLDESWHVALSSFTPTGAVGERIDAIPYTAKGTVHVMAFREDAMNAALQQALTSQLTEDFMLFPGPISYTKSVEKADWDAGPVRLTTRVTHTTIPTFSLETLKDKLAGRKQDEAQSYLTGLPGVQNASIELWPFWVQRVPEIQKRIDIQLSSDR